MIRHKRLAFAPMSNARDVSAALLTLAIVAVGCAAQPQASLRDVADANDTGGTVAAGTATERAVLAALPRLAATAPERINGLTVMAQTPYLAASGRTCRAVSLTSPKGGVENRLACSDGRSWFFVPNVFSSPTSTE
jgi:hypothetical protein